MDASELPVLFMGEARDDESLDYTLHMLLVYRVVEAVALVRDAGPRFLRINNNRLYATTIRTCVNARNSNETLHGVYNLL